MDVATLTEGFHHVLVLAQVCHDAQLYLRVVGREEQAAWLWNEATANLLAIIIPYWDILQVRVAG